MWTQEDRSVWVVGISDILIKKDRRTVVQVYDFVKFAKEKLLQYSGKVLIIEIILR